MEDLSGSVVDKYRLNRSIGSGGMGTVYEAVHTLIGRRCALKLLHARHAQDDELAKRMLREAQAAAAIGHPNIVETTDFGVTEEGTHFLVMEYLEGATLKRLLKAWGSLDVELTRGIVSQVLAALDAAHAKGIVHRDLKPDNVFIARTPLAGDVVKLLDFGISKVLNVESESSRLTTTGTVLGTPHYMSPEQAAGSRDVDARSDLWSVGVMLYEVLTGQLPFPGENYNQIIVGIVTQRFKTPRDVRPDLDPSLESVILRSLDKDPARRFQSATQMCTALLGHAADSRDPAPRAVLPPSLLDKCMAEDGQQAPATVAGPPSAPPVASSPGQAETEQSAKTGPIQPAAPEPAQSSPVPPTRVALPIAAVAPAPVSPAPAPPGQVPPDSGDVGSEQSDTIGTQPRGQVSIHQSAPGMVFSPKSRRMPIGIGIGAFMLMAAIVVYLASSGDDGEKKSRYGFATESSPEMSDGMDLGMRRPSDRKPVKPPAMPPAMVGTKAPAAMPPAITLPVYRWPPEPMARPQMKAAAMQEPAPRPKLKLITVVQSVWPKGASVFLDGKRRRDIPLRLRTDGKKHVLKVSSRGFWPRKYKFVASESHKPLTIRLRWRRRWRPARPPTPP